MKNNQWPGGFMNQSCCRSKEEVGFSLTAQQLGRNELFLLFPSSSWNSTTLYFFKNMLIVTFNVAEQVPYHSSSYKRPFPRRPVSLFLIEFYSFWLGKNFAAAFVIKTIRNGGDTRWGDTILWPSLWRYRYRITQPCLKEINVLLALTFGF